MNDRGEYRQKEPPEVIGRRFMALCSQVGFGKIEVEVSNGVPKDVKVVFQSWRLDLTDPAADGTLGVPKRGGTSHDGVS